MNTNGLSPSKTSSRQQALVELLKTQGSMSVSELAEYFNCSMATIRRDLASVEVNFPHVRRMHGAVSVSPAMIEERFQDKTTTCQQEKEAIADALIEWLPDGVTIGLNGGTTTSAIAAKLAEQQKDVTVVTNAINIALLLTEVEIPVVVIGGILRRPNYETTGHLALTVLERVQLDWAILGTNGIHPRFGITTNTEQEAAVGRAFCDRAQRTLIVADHTKWGRAALFKLAEWDQVHFVASDLKAQATWDTWGPALSFLPVFTRGDAGILELEKSRTGAAVARRVGF